jgi:hypothetical protein
MRAGFPASAGVMIGRRLLIPLLVIPVLAAAPAEARTTTTAVGKVNGTEAFLAVSYDGQRLRAYACDGSARRLPTISKRFKTRWDGRSPISAGGLSIDRMLPRDGRIRGRLHGHRFTLEPATGPAGLYDRTRWNVRRTSVVLPDGSIRGVSRPAGR